MAKFFRSYGIFLIIPGIVGAFTILLRLASGPFWLAPNFDPSYAYIVNGLYLIKGLVPNHTDHPGTPLQLLCATVCWLFNMGRSAEDVVLRGLLAPEFYLHVVFGILLLMSFLTSVFLAVYVFRKTGDKLAAVLSQLPFLNFLVMKSWESPLPVLPVVANVDPEPMLISMVNFFNIGLLMSFFAKTSRDKFIATLFWGFMAGMGVAVKLTFLPLLIIPLIILPWKDKAFFVGATVASFVMWTLPILSKYHIIEDWFAGVVVNKGPGEFFSHYLYWKNIVLDQGIFTLFLFAALILVAWKFAVKKWDRATAYLAAIILGSIFQFFVVTQHPGAHYLLPGVGLFSVLLVMFYLQGPNAHLLGQRIILFIIVVTVLLGSWSAINYRSQVARFTNDIISSNNDIHDKYKGYIFLGFYRSSGKENALRFGDGWNGESKLRNELFKEYPNSYFYNIWANNRIMSFQDRVLSDDLLSQSEGLIFQGDDTYDINSALTGSPFTIRLLEKGRLENFYLLTATTEKQAAMYFMAAAHFFQAGDYPKSLACALQAKAFHYQPVADVDTLIKFEVNR